MSDYHVPTAEERYGKTFIDSLSTKTYRELRWWVSFHYIEGMMQCPFYVFHKHLLHGAAEALGAENRLGWRDNIFSSGSADLLGKALMAGIQYGPDEALREYQKGLKPEADMIAAEAYQQTILARATAAAKALEELADGGMIEVEKPFIFIGRGGRVRGHIDALIHHGDISDLVEIKCSGNSDFVEHRSMQAFFYGYFMEHTGTKIRDAYYVLFDKWSKGGAAYQIIKNPSRTERQINRFWAFGTQLMDTPLDEKLWPAKGYPNKCETCQFSRLCRA